MNAAQFFDHWNTVWRDLMRGVSMLEDKHLDFRPTEHYPRSVRGILLHITNLEQGWIHYVVRRELDAWPDEGSLELDTVEALSQEMERVHSHTMEYLATVEVEDFTRIVAVVHRQPRLRELVAGRHALFEPFRSPAFFVLELQPFAHRLEGGRLLVVREDAGVDERGVGP